MNDLAWFGLLVCAVSITVAVMVLYFFFRDMGPD